MVKMKVIKHLQWELILVIFIKKYVKDTIIQMKKIAIIIIGNQIMEIVY